MSGRDAQAGRVVCFPREAPRTPSARLAASDVRGRPWWRDLAGFLSAHWRDLVAGVSVALLVAAAIVVAFALAYNFWAARIERERETASVTAVGAVLFVSAPYATVAPDPGMAAPGCLLAAGGAAKSLGGDVEGRVKVEVAPVATATAGGVPQAGPGPTPCVPGTVGYAEVHGTWFVRHHD